MQKDYKNARILIVDDKIANIELLEDLLLQTGFENLKSLTDSREVVKVYKSFKPDLILLDLMMPYLSGFEVMDELKKVIAPTTYLPILALTAEISYETKKKALSGGAKDFLSKPFDLNEVILRINNLLETRYLHELLNKNNKELEKKVNERTEELEQANSRLNAANKELEVLDTAKLEFLKLISHEIRTPLNGILGFTDMLKSQINSPELNNYITYLETSAERLQRFSLQALLVTELRTKKYVLDVKKTDIKTLYANAVKKVLCPDR